MYIYICIDIYRTIYGRSYRLDSRQCIEDRVISLLNTFLNQQYILRILKTLLPLEGPASSCGRGMP